MARNKIEYRYKHFFSKGALKSHNDHYIEWLNWQGQDGWELVYAEKIRPYEYNLILMRETIDEKD